MPLNTEPMRCALTVEAAGEATTLAAAYALLPAAGEGVVVFADRIERFRPGLAAGLLTEAEVAHGDVTTVIRMSGGTWRAWRWHEAAGDTHRCFETAYLSSEPAPAGTAPALRYRRYWALTPDDDGINVWQPAGARFAGFARS